MKGKSLLRKTARLGNLAYREKSETMWVFIAIRKLRLLQGTGIQRSRLQRTECLWIVSTNDLIIFRFLGIISTVKNKNRTFSQ